MTTLQTLIVVIGMDPRPLQAGATQASASMGKLNSSAKAGFASIGLGATAAGVAIAGFAVHSIKAAIDYEKAFTRIEAITNASTAQIGQWRDSVITLAGETAKAPTELADALFFVASSGLKASQIMPTLEASAKAAAVGLGETKDIAQIVTSVLNAYGKSAGTAAEVTDTLVAAVREGKAEPEEFATALGRILPIASAAGVSFDEVAASMSVLSNIGLDVNEGVTAMRGLLNALVAPGSQAADALASIGISAEQMREVISEKGILGALDLLEERTGGNIDMLRLIIPNIRAMTGALGISGQAAQKTAGIYDRVRDSQGSLADAFEETQQQTEFKLTKALNDLSIAGQQLGAAVLPMLAAAASVAAETFSEMSQEASTWLGWIQDLVDKIPGASEETDGWSFSIGGLFKGLQTLANPFKQIMDPIGRWKEALHEITGTTDDATGAITDNTKAIGTSTQGMGHLVSASGEVKSAAEGVAQATNHAAEAHREAAAAARDQRSAELALTDKFLGLIDSAKQVQESQATVARLQRRGKTDTGAYATAVSELLNNVVTLKQGMIEYAAELIKQGQSHKQVVNTLKALGRQYGLQKGDVSDLIGRVDDLIGKYGSIPKSVTTHIKADASQAFSVAEQLDERLEEIEHKQYIATIRVATTGGSTGFHLIDMLEARMLELGEKPYPATIEVKANTPDLQLAGATRTLAGGLVQAGMAGGRMQPAEHVHRVAGRVSLEGDEAWLELKLGDGQIVDRALSRAARKVRT